MPHAAFFGLSVVMMLVFQALSVLFALIECGATEPLSRNFLSLSSEPAWGLGGRCSGHCPGDTSQPLHGGPARRPSCHNATASALCSLVQMAATSS